MLAWAKVPFVKKAGSRNRSAGIEMNGNADRPRRPRCLGLMLADDRRRPVDQANSGEEEDLTPNCAPIALQQAII